MTKPDDRDEKNPSDLGGPYARDPDFNGAGSQDDYARDRGFSGGGGRNDFARETIDAEPVEASVNPSPAVREKVPRSGG